MVRAPSSVRVGKKNESGVRAVGGSKVVSFSVSIGVH
jgi:hypothetical protein